MAKDASQHSRFKSRFGGGFQTDSQFLAEGMCARQARKDGIDLPLKFWTEGRWKREYALQLRHAVTLLKIYSVEAILKALRSPRAQRVYSLGAKFLDPIIKIEQEKLDRQPAPQPATPESEQPTPPPTTSPARPAFIEKPSVISKLRDL